MVIDSVEVGYNGVCLRRTGRYGGFREVHEVCLRRTCWWGRILGGLEKNIDLTGTVRWVGGQVVVCTRHTLT